MKELARAQNVVKDPLPRAHSKARRPMTPQLPLESKSTPSLVRPAARMEQDGVDSRPPTGPKPARPKTSAKQAAQLKRQAAKAEAREKAAEEAQARLAAKAGAKEKAEA